MLVRLTGIHTLVRTIISKGRKIYPFIMSHLHFLERKMTMQCLGHNFLCANRSSRLKSVLCVLQYAQKKTVQYPHELWN